MSVGAPFPPRSPGVPALMVSTPFTIHESELFADPITCIVLGLSGRFFDTHQGVGCIPSHHSNRNIQTSSSFVVDVTVCFSDLVARGLTICRHWSARTRSLGQDTRSGVYDPEPSQYDEWSGYTKWHKGTVVRHCYSDWRSCFLSE
jgi:hypothetical protein